MPSPTFVSKVETTGWSSASSPQTVSATVASGDLLVVNVLGEAPSMGFGTPSGGSLTYTQRQLVQQAGQVDAGVWTAPGGSGSFTLSETATAAFDWGISVIRFSGAAVGASGKNWGSSTTPTLTFTTTTDHSAIVVYIDDGNAQLNAGYTWNTSSGGTFTELTSVNVPSHHTVYGGYYADSGTAGSKTVGMSTSPGSMTWSLVALEVIAPGGATATPRKTFATAQARTRASSW